MIFKIFVWRCNKIEFILTIGGFLVLYILSSLKIIDQYEKGVTLTLGKFTGIKTAGLRVVLLGLQKIIKVDTRVKAVDVPDQDCITKDNISVNVNAVIYYRVTDVTKAVLEVEHYNYAVSQLAQTTMRNVVGEFELDGLLSNRDAVSEKIQRIVDKETDPWGIKVQTVDLKDVVLPDDIKRVIGKQAEAEREKRAVIIKAEGEVIAAENIAKGAEVLSKSAGALHIRTLQTLNDLSSDQSNTVVFAVPLEILRAFDGLKK